MSKSEQDFKKVMKGLRKFPQNIQKNVMSGATRAAAVQVQKAAKANAPEDSGTLKNSIVVRKSRSKNKAITAYRVAVTYGSEKRKGITGAVLNDAYYASMVEFGTRKFSAQPFMRPAARSSAAGSVTVARNYIAKRLPKEAAKIKAG